MIELKGVSAAYGGRDARPVLCDISTSFEKGSLTVILGPNGSGKSTLLKTAVGIIRPVSGQIWADGERCDGMPPHRLAKRISYLAQSRYVPDMTAFQLVLHGRFAHLGYPRRYSKKDKEISLAAMHQLGIESLAEKPVSSLSGGMRQCVYIAMALAQDTDYILLDEPTAFLDIANRFRLMEILRTLANGGEGVVAVLHDIPLAMEYADSLLLLSGGRTEAEGNVQELFSNGSIDRVFGASLERSACETGGYSYYFRKVPPQSDAE